MKCWNAENITAHTGDVRFLRVNARFVFDNAFQEPSTSRVSDCARAVAGPEIVKTLSGLKMSAERDLGMSAARMTINFR